MNIIYWMLVVPYFLLNAMLAKYFVLWDKIEHDTVGYRPFHFPSWWNQSTVSKIKILRFILWLIAFGGIYGATRSIWKSVLINIVVYIASLITNYNILKDDTK